MSPRCNAQAARDHEIQLLLHVMEEKGNTCHSTGLYLPIDNWRSVMGSCSLVTS